MCTIMGQPVQGIDRHGSKWTLRGEEGYWSSPEVRRTRVQKAQQDGAHPSTSVLDAHTFTFEGVIRADDNETLLRSKDDLLALAYIGEGVLDWTDATGRYLQDVELDGVIKTRLHGARVMEWQLTLTAPDPAKYSPDVLLTAVLHAKARAGEGWQWPREYPTDWHEPTGEEGISDRVALYNAGNTPWWPRMRLQTTAATPRISCPETGEWIQYNGQLSEGQWLDIDCRQRTVLLNGVTSQKWCTAWAGSWLAVYPGMRQTLQLTAAGEDPDGTLTIIAKEGAWL